MHITDEDIAHTIELLEKGWGRERIARYLKITNSQARRRIDKARAEMVPNTAWKKVTQDSVNAGNTTLETARALKTRPGMAKAWESKVQGTFCPAEAEFKKDVSKGTTLNKLKNKYGINTISELEQELSSVFDDDNMPMLFTKDLKDDVAIYIIPDNRHKFDWFTKTRPTPQFKVHVNPDNNYMFVELGKNLPDKVTIYNLTDLHIGSKHCRTELLKQHIKMIAEDPGALAFIGGDTFEYMHKQSVGQPWEQAIAPMEQVSVSARMLFPIAHKIIRYVGGNHDRGRGYNAVGADLAEVLANYLGCSYGHMETVIDIKHRDQLFTAILHHGSGSGGSLQNIVIEAEKYMKSSAFFVHWHMSGHVHNSHIIKRNMSEKVEGKGLIPKRCFTVIGGSYIKRVGTYAEEMKFSPAPQDLTFITMEASGKYDAGSIPIDSD